MSEAATMGRDLNAILNAVEGGWRHYVQLCMTVYDVVRAEHPSLHALISELGWPQEQAGVWLCQSHPRWGKSPAAVIAEGAAKEVETLILQSLHGTVA